MQKVSPVVCASILVLQSSAALASDCADLGFTSEYLQLHFCEELKSVANSGSSTTRGATGATDDLPQLGGDLTWESFPIVQDAYRADPATTLELIERIRKSGGLTQ